MDEDKRDRIHQAALAVFGRRGFHETTVEEIARQAGVAKGTVYLYFASKADILVDAFRRYLDQVLDFVDGLINSDLSASAILAAFVDRQRTLRQEEPNLVRVLTRRSLQALRDGDEKMAEFNRYLLDRVARLLQLGKENGELRPFDARIGACIILAMQEAIPLYLATYGDGEDETAITQVTQELSRFMWASVRKELA